MLRFLCLICGVLAVVASALFSGYCSFGEAATALAMGGVGITAIWPNKFRTRFKTVWDTMTLAGTTGVSTAILDFATIEHGVFIVGRHSGTAFTQAEILVSENSDLSSPVVLKTKTGLAMDGANDFCVLEVRRDEVMQLAAEAAGANQFTSHVDYRYVGIRMTGTTGDICTVTALGESDRAYEDLTPEVTNN